ncbi:NACHT domain-containing protein [Herbidospora sp. RD11066]
MQATRSVVFHEERGPSWESAPLEGTIHQLTAAFRALPYRQLVILGEAGAGKSVMAVLLTLGLLEDRQGSEPIPILLPISSWNPTAETIERFLVRRLEEEYDFLGHKGRRGGSWAEELVSQRRIIPILDGLDEIPRRLQPQAIRALDALATSKSPFVATCRGASYEYAVGAVGRVLSRAAVVEIKPLDIDLIADFFADQEPFADRWKPVIDRLRDEPGGPLAQAMATPLHVSLARDAFPQPTHPSQLLKLTSRTAVEAAVMDRFMKTEYRAGPSDPSARWRTYRPEKAITWLGYLAHGLHGSGVRDWSWSSLDTRFAFTRHQWIRHSLPLILTAGIVFGMGVVGHVTTGGGGGARFAFASFLVVGAGATGLFRSVWFRGIAHESTEHRLLRLTFGVICGFATGLVLNDLSLMLSGAAVGGAGACFLSFGEKGRSESPCSVLKGAISAGVRFALLGCAAFALARLLLLNVEPDRITASALTAACVYGLGAVIDAGLWRLMIFRVSHVILALRGRLPFRLNRFLDDAHRRHVLRRSGNVWQFRHALLQDHLGRAAKLKYLGEAAARGDWPSYRAMIEMLVSQGRADEALQSLRTPGRPFDWRISWLVDKLNEQASREHRLATYRLVNLLIKVGRDDEAMEILTTCAKAGDQRAVIRLAELLADLGKSDQAFEVLESFSVHHDIAVHEAIIDLLARLGRVADLTTYADGGHSYALEQLLELLTSRSDTKAMIPLLRRRSAAGDAVAIKILVTLLETGGQVSEACDLLRAMPDELSRTRDELLVGLLVRIGRNDEAIETIRNSLRLSAEAPLLLARLLHGAGRPDEAIGYLKSHPLLEVRDLLGEFMLEVGMLNEAVDLLGNGKHRYVRPVGVWRGKVRKIYWAVYHQVWTRRDFRAPPRYSKRRLVDLLAGHDKAEEAIGRLRLRADGGDRDAAHWLSELRRKRDRVRRLKSQVGQGLRLPRGSTGYVQARDTALRLRQLAKAGDLEAAESLLDSLDAAEQYDEAAIVLRSYFDIEILDNLRKLANLLEKAGRVEEAIALLRAHMGGGEWDRTQLLVDLLDRHDRLSEAIAVIRMSIDSWNRYTEGMGRARPALLT